MIRTTNKGLEYGGSCTDIYWTNVSISNTLPNCTTYVFGRCKEEGVQVPIKAGNEDDAKNWHKHLINGWTYIKYDPGKVHVGDVIEWSRGNHVAYVEKISNGVIYISGSFYTGDHGKSYYGGGYDKRSQTTYKQVSDYYLKNYSYRFFHYVPIETESSWCGYSPDYILVAPKKDEVVVTPVEKDATTDQIYVDTNEQYVRDNDNKILGIAVKGFYNVLNSREKSGYTWYEVEPGKSIAGVAGRVFFYEATDIPDKSIEEYKLIIENLENQVTELKATVKEKDSVINKMKSYATKILEL